MRVYMNICTTFLKKMNVCIVEKRTNMTFSNPKSEIRCTVLPEHTEFAISVAWSPDSSIIVSGSYDGTVRIWDAVTGELQQTLPGHTYFVKSVAWSPDSTRIVSGSRDKTVRIWDAVTGELQQTLTGHTDWVRYVAWSPDSTRIVSGSRDNTVRIWEDIGDVSRQIQINSSSLVCTDVLNTIVSYR
jgi:WD40 repeat protein